MKRRHSVLFVTIIVTSCGDIGFTAAVIDRQPFSAPEVYRDWWRATETCSARRGNYDRIVWYTASGIAGGTAVGRARWTSPHDIIIVRGYENDEKVVRHEMLHDLLGGDRGHQRPEWDACQLHVDGA